MELDKAISIIDLVTDVSPYGILFIALIISPLILGGFQVISKGFQVSSKQKINYFLLTPIIVLVFALVLLKLGIENEKWYQSKGKIIKYYLISKNWKTISYRDLTSLDPALNKNTIDKIIEKIPNEFAKTKMIPRFESDTLGIYLVDTASVSKINVFLSEIARMKISDSLDSNSIISEKEIIQLDTRFDRSVIEYMVLKNRNEFTLIKSEGIDNYSVKAIR